MPRKLHSSTRSGEILRRAISLRGTVPSVSRHVEVPESFTFDRLHRVIQAAFGWTNSHPYEFEVGRILIGFREDDSDRTIRDDRRTRLIELWRTDVSRFVYRYDFGDDWVHDVVVETRVSVPDITTYPACTGGLRSAPPEDCGGTGGYEELLLILNDPLHSRHVETKRWVGRRFDPERFDRERTNRALKRLRPKR